MQKNEPEKSNAKIPTQKIQCKIQRRKSIAKNELEKSDAKIPTQKIQRKK